MIVQARWRWEPPTATSHGTLMPDIELWTELADGLPTRLEIVVIEAMRHATNECGYAGTNPFECPHIAEAMDAAFSAAEQALPPEPSITPAPTTGGNQS